MEEKVQGILLSATAYLGSSRILKVFTEQLGLLSFIAKGVQRKNWAAFTTPFCVAEWVFRKGKEEIHLLKDATLLNGLPHLKKDFTTISTAGSIAQDLLTSQLPSKKGEGLYFLTLSYLEKLPSFNYPENLSASFRLKLLLWEGLLSLSEQCSQCPSKASALSSGESFCQTHAPIGNSFFFNPEEWESLLILALSRKFSSLDTGELSQGLLIKIKDLFKEIIR